MLKKKKKKKKKKKGIMAYVHQLLDQPSQWQTFQQAGPGSVPEFTSTSITVKQLLIKNKNINQSKSSRLIWHYVSYFFLFYSLPPPFFLFGFLRPFKIISLILCRINRNPEKNHLTIHE